MSGWAALSHGVPLGSALGPLLFPFCMPHLVKLINILITVLNSLNVCFTWMSSVCFIFTFLMFRLDVKCLKQ